MALIGLTGYARSGKDTAGAHLIADFEFERRAFADGVKTAAFHLNPIVKTEIEWVAKGWFGRSKPTVKETRLQEYVWAHGREIAKEHPEVRAIYQRMGTEVGRKMFGEDVWVDALLNTYHHDLHRWVVTDVRFPNEAKAIQNLGGKVVRITRPGVEAVNGHVSEHAMDDYPVDDEVLNDGTVTRLGDRMHDLVNEWGWE